jgi:hypothetical protein
MQMGGINPYTSFLVDYFDARQDNADLYSMSDSRLSMSSAGKIQATMSHPMQWILHLSLLTVIMSVYLIKTKKKLYAVLICFMVFNIFIAGVRTGIAALLIGFLYFCIREKKVKTILYVVILLLVVLSFNSDLKILFNSFIALEEGSVNGSSIAMRLEQLDGVFQEIGGYKLFVGKGYGWHNYYLLQNEFHPIILCFESLIFSVLCDSGLIGAGIWIVFFLLLFRLQRRILSTKTDIYLMDVMVIVYSGYVVGTGDYGYMLPFSIYYTFLMCALKTKIIQNNK